MIDGAGDVIGKPAPRQAMTMDHPPAGEQAPSARLASIRQHIAAACDRVDRDPATVRLVAVSKTFDANDLQAMAGLGQDDFGESYLQEAIPKIEQVSVAVDRALQWHFIGPIQSNKTAAVASHFGWVHGVDRLKIAQRLSTQRPDASPPLQICVQVNVTGEDSKSGCVPEEALKLCGDIAALPRLQLRGLMCIPEATGDPRPAFARLRQLHQQILATGDVDPALFDQLSMGMSDDFEIAIEEAATIIRVGSALFGSRPRKSQGDPR